MAVIEIFILVACSLLIPDEIIRFKSWLLRERAFPIWERVESAFSALEVLSFAFLFGFGALVLESHRYPAAMYFFWAGCVLLSVRMVAIAYKDLTGVAKWVFVLLICAGAISLYSYLCGISLDAQREYLIQVNEKGNDALKQFVAEHQRIQPTTSQAAASKEVPPPRVPPKDRLRFTSFEVLPYASGKPLQIKIHVLNSSESSIEGECLWNTYSVPVLNFDNFQQDYETRKSLEDKLWKEFDAGLLLKKTSHRFNAFPVAQDAWNMADSRATLTDAEIAGNAPGKALYLLVRIVKKSGVVLAEACIWMVPEDRQHLYFCAEHN